MSSKTADDVIGFWKSLGPKGWFTKDDKIDTKIRNEFGELYEKAAAGKLDDWCEKPENCLAFIILLDQFSRNMFRNNARAFSQDARALSAANRALESDFHGKVESQLAVFLYMPFMHSESILDQNRCVYLMHRDHRDGNLSYAIQHRDIIHRFGRFPHRNSVLGRSTSNAERDYLESGGFKG